MQEEADAVIEKGALAAVEVWNQEGIDKNVAKGMELLPFSPEVRDAVKKTLRDHVIPDWIKRTSGQQVDGKTAVELFNEIIAPLVGYEVQS